MEGGEGRGDSYGCERGWGDWGGGRGIGEKIEGGGSLE
jgi:hypothetical protein